MSLYNLEIGEILILKERFSCDTKAKIVTELHCVKYARKQDFSDCILAYFRGW